ncbi:hypothetical protein B0T18DRAFT_320916 [Schizothecium vesticola]|uniref:BTB domain-containing protein n=1 Tax=Schizothecium vesticola TaxID=314040 RepID=A0AA40K7Y8_9PEZI|nr:hypothetical protein B0T18DRAFT_320916 [Schizothecium vesticola]
MVLRKHELESRLKDDHELITSGVLRDDHPLDLSTQFDDFIHACRRGDLKRCQELIVAGVNINGKDQFDYTPLVIASLCGHYELVRLLLDEGAIADPDSFERERAVYNALNNKIRNLLLSYDYSKAADPLQPWASHINSLFTRTTPKTSDVTLLCGDQAFRLHKFILSARSPYFRTKFDGRDTLRLPPAIPVEAYRLVLRYLYLGDPPKDVVGPRSTVPEHVVFEGIDKLCKVLEIDNFWDTVLSKDRRLARQRQQDEVQRAQAQIEAFFDDTVIKHRVVVDSHLVDAVKWPHDNSIFANCLLRADEPADDDDTNDDEATPVEYDARTIPIGPATDNNRPSSRPKKSPRSVLYPVHKAFLIRCEFFDKMFTSEYKEAHDKATLQIIRTTCSPVVLEVILRYLYTEKADCPLEHALDLLYEADYYLIDRLKTKAAVIISTMGSGSSNALVDRTHQHQDGDDSSSPEAEAEAEGDPEEPINVYDVLRAAWDLRVQRLEEFAARFLAGRLEDYIDEPAFEDLIAESAARIKDRHETDTIELLDDIRYYLSERFRLRFEGEGLEELLDDEGGPGAGGGEAIGLGEEEEAARGGESDEGGRKLGGGMRTLDGGVVGDEFESDAVNYHVLLGKIDAMLERLKLDA